MVVDTLYAAPPAPYLFTWSTVVNNNDYMPTDGCVDGQPANSAAKCRHFNSYNQPSVNGNGLVVIRARSSGGEGGAGDGGEGGGGNGDAGSGSEGHQPVHGIYTRDMSNDSPTVSRESPHRPDPRPYERGTSTEQPRHHVHRDAVLPAHRHVVGHHRHPRQPPAGVGIHPAGRRHETRAGTTGIYTNPFGDLITRRQQARRRSRLLVLRGAGSAHPAHLSTSSPGPRGDRWHHHRVQGQLHGGWRGQDRSVLPRPSGGSLDPAGGTNPVVLIANTDTSFPARPTPCSAPPPRPARPTARWCSPASTTRRIRPRAASTGAASMNQPREAARLSSRPLVSIGDQVPGENNKARV